MRTRETVVSLLRQVARLRRWTLPAAALLAFAAGSLLTARLMQLKAVRADNERVFELMVYHTMPGKVPVLEEIFRNVSKMQEKYGLQVVGYWVPKSEEAAWANTFVYVVAHPSQEKAKENWKALHSDPAFPPYRQKAAEILEKTGDNYHVDEVFMRPTDFSALK